MVIGRPKILTERSEVIYLEIYLMRPYETY